MTNDHAAGRSNIRRSGLVGLVAALALGLAGCETTTGLFGSSGDSSAATPVAQSAPAAQPAFRVRVALAPVIGAPEAVSRQISQQLASSLEQRQIAVAKPGEASDFTIRGYLVAAKEKTSTKVSYIWDVNDPAGKRINRVTGEEAAASTAERDPWSAVTPQTVQAIADRTATNLATSLPAGQQPVAVAGALQTAGGQNGTPRAAATTTASIGQTGGLLAIVPAVSGAPGDGSQALAQAMQKELTRNGIQLAQGPTTSSAYRVEGKVQVGQGKGGVQPIQIEWQVKDPRGTKLGTVSQKNDIPQGSLDGTWGQTAEIAAAAAAQGVIKLLPQTQTN